MTHTTHDPKGCQVCGERFATTVEKGIHVTTAHDLRRTGGRDRTRQFIACQCGQRTYVGMNCTCGLTAAPAAWSHITRTTGRGKPHDPAEQDQSNEVWA